MSRLLVASKTITGLYSIQFHETLHHCKNLITKKWTNSFDYESLTFKKMPQSEVNERKRSE